MAAQHNHHITCIFHLSTFIWRRIENSVFYTSETWAVCTKYHLEKMQKPWYCIDTKRWVQWSCKPRLRIPGKQQRKFLKEKQIPVSHKKNSREKYLPASKILRPEEWKRFAKWRLQDWIKGTNRGICWKPGFESAPPMAIHLPKGKCSDT